MITRPWIFVVLTWVGAAAASLGCIDACPPGAIRCVRDSVCLSIQTDRQNCGGCGRVCGDTQECRNGACVCAESAEACGPNACVFIQTDPFNCGSCANACPSNATCEAGRCVCQQGRLCNGRCFDTENDAANCGRCGFVCPSPLACRAGTCSCAVAGNSVCQDRCVDTQSDTGNCGLCGVACPLEATCIQGGCQCRAGLDLCRGQCVDVQSDPRHCGGCGVSCSVEQECIAGRCGCPVSRTACGSECPDLLTSSRHCGRCDNACATGSSCQAGTCAVDRWLYTAFGAYAPPASVDGPETRVALDASGRAFVAWGIGGGLRVVRIARSGVVDWSAMFSGSTRVGGVEADGAGGCFVVADIQSDWSPTSTGVALRALGSSGVVVAHLDAAGRPTWETRLASGVLDRSSTLDASSTALVVALESRGALPRGAGRMTTADPSGDIVVLTFSLTTGAVVDGFQLGGSSAELPTGVALGPGNLVYVAGKSFGGLGLGGTSISAGNFVAAFGLDGAPRGLVRLPVEAIGGVAADASSVYVAATAGGDTRSTDFGNGVTVPAWAGVIPVQLALDTMSLRARWASSVLEGNNGKPGDVAIGPTGVFYVQSRDATRPGGMTTGRGVVLVERRAASGALLAMRVLDGLAREWEGGVAVIPGFYVVAGRYENRSSTIDGIALPTPLQADVFALGTRR